MRITGGTLCGRRVAVPSRGVRPSQDKLREALFGSLAAMIPGTRFLDLFAGSGSVGLEAWSRGASHVCWVEQDYFVAKQLETNIRSLCSPDQGVGTVEVVRSEVFRWLGRAQRNIFDIIFADPPYNSGSDCPIARLLPKAVIDAGILADEGLLIIEERAGRGEWALMDWQVIRDRKYGGSRLVFLKKVARGDDKK